MLSMCFPTCAVLGSFFLVASFVLELFLIIGQVSNRWFLTKLNFMEAWNSNQNLSYTFGLWNYCTGDGNRNIMSCASTQVAYNWAKTPIISNLVPNLANSKVITGLFFALFILIFISMGFSFIFWVMTFPILCTKHKRGWGFSMTTLCFINFLITLACVILSLILVLVNIRDLTNASQNWRAHASNSLWIIIGVCISNFIAMFCYSGGACCSSKYRKREDDEYDAPAADKKRGWFGRKNKTQVDPVEYKDTTNYNNLLPTTAQPMYNHSPNPNQQHTMLQQPYAYNDPASPLQPNTTGVTQQHTGVARATYDPQAPGATTTHGYQTPTLQPANALN